MAGRRRVVRRREADLHDARRYDPPRHGALQPRQRSIGDLGGRAGPGRANQRGHLLRHHQAGRGVHRHGRIPAAGARLGGERREEPRTSGRRRHGQADSQADAQTRRWPTRRSSWASTSTSATRRWRATYWERAQALAPDNWNYHRQDWNLTEGLAGPKYREKRGALGDKPYYAPLEAPPPADTTTPR